jgi:hypothetical protein
MSTTTSTPADRTFGYADLAAMLVGFAVFGYGLLLVSASLLGGLWIAAIGLSLLLAGLFNTRWAGTRLGISTPDRRTLAVTFTVLSAVLLVAFVAINGFGVEGGFAVEGSSTGGD